MSGIRCLQKTVKIHLEKKKKKNHCDAAIIAHYYHLFDRGFRTTPPHRELSRDHIYKAISAYWGDF